MNRAFLTLLVVTSLGTGGCLQSVDLSGRGLACHADEDCHGQGPCLLDVCQGFAGGVDAQPSTPTRVGFYQVWYPDNWNSGVKETPSAGEYRSDDPRTLQRHLDSFQWGNLQVAAVSWYGPENGSSQEANDTRFASLLAFTEDAGVATRVALVYERDAVDQNTAGEVPIAESLMREHLAYAARTYALSPAYWRIDGRFVFFVDFDFKDGCDRRLLWLQAASELDGGMKPYLVLRRTPPMQSCPSDAADESYDLTAGTFAKQVNPDVFGVNPGFRQNGELRLGRDAGAFESAVEAMVASGSRFQLVDSFNNWNDGTEVESATAWPSDSGFGAYLDILHAHP